MDNPTLLPPPPAPAVVAPCWMDNVHSKELSQADLVYEEALTGKVRADPHKSPNAGNMP